MLILNPHYLTLILRATNAHGHTGAVRAWEMQIYVKALIKLCYPYMVTKSLSCKRKKRQMQPPPPPPPRADNMPVYADWPVELEEDVVSGSGGDGPEEVLSQVGLLQSVALVHLWDQRGTAVTHTALSLLCHCQSTLKMKMPCFVTSTRHLHGSGNLCRRVDVHLVQQRLQEVLVLQDNEQQMGLRRKWLGMSPKIDGCQEAWDSL